MPDEPPSNALGLQFSQQTVEDKEPEVPEIVSKSPTSPSESPKKKDVKEKPYVNPDRVKTGGAQRDKLSEEALAEKMARMREQNEKIRLRRLDVQADEEAFRKTQEQDREKQAQNRKIQADIDRARDQNARRKMDKAQYRDWDSGKPSVNKKSGPGPQELTEGMKDSDNAPAGTVDWANAPLDQPAGLEPKEETTTSNDWGPTASETTTQDWGVTPASSDIQETKDWSGAPITAQDWGLPPSAGDASTTDWSGAPIAAQDWGSVDSATTPGGDADSTNNAATSERGRERGRGRGEGLGRGDGTRGRGDGIRRRGDGTRWRGDGARARGDGSRGRGDGARGRGAERGRGRGDSARGRGAGERGRGSGIGSARGAPASS